MMIMIPTCDGDDDDILKTVVMLINAQATKRKKIYLIN